jgi:Fe-S cluster assembly protein SufD
VRVPAGVSGGVLHVVHLVSGQGTAHVRTVVTLEDDASLTLGATHIGWGEAAYFVNAVTEVSLARGASLSLGKCVREGKGGSHLEAVHARVSESARLATYTLSLTGARVRTGINVTLAGASASADVDGLYLGKGREVLDHVTDIRHAVGDTRSSQQWSGVLDDRAEGGFQGVIRIDAGAVKSATRQLTKTLLLSDGAEAHARPELHIDCDEVEASHGATVGQLDANERYYLESRGIPPDESRRILIRAFVDTQLVRAPEALRRDFAEAVTELLGPGAMTVEMDDGV